MPTDLETEKMLRRLQELQNRQQKSPQVKAEISRLRKKVNEQLITDQTDAQIATFETLLKKAMAKPDKTKSAEIRQLSGRKTASRRRGRAQKRSRQE